MKDHGMVARGDHVILGLSGGPDSLTLFTVLREMAETEGFTLHAVHVNHKLRPGAAEADRDFVVALCEAAGVDLFVVEEDCAAYAKAHRLTEEAAGREIRYNAFFKRDQAHGTGAVHFRHSLLRL